MVSGSSGIEMVLRALIREIESASPYANLYCCRVLLRSHHKLVEHGIGPVGVGVYRLPIYSLPSPLDRSPPIYSPFSHIYFALPRADFGQMPSYAQVALSVPLALALLVGLVAAQCGYPAIAPIECTNMHRDSIQIS